jgi:hypothetical protein
MAKTVPKKCRDCAATLCTAEASSKSCWDSKICVPRRRNLRYRSKPEPAPGALSVPIPNVAYFVLRLWQTSEQRHAIGMELWRGEDLVGAIKPVHVTGVSKLVVNDWMAGSMALLREIHSEPDAVLRDQRVEHTSKCPIGNCPLRS